jgi:hypothetical protein
MRIKVRSAKGMRGSAVIELSLAMAYLLPLMIGVFVYGFKLIRSLEMYQVTRDVGVMYLRGVDFRNNADGTVSGAQQTVRNLATTFTLTSTGTSDITVSKVKLVTQADCDAANLLPTVVAPGTACTNLGKTTFMEQYTIGNTAAGGSAFGAPPVQPTTCTPISAGVPCSYTVTVYNLGRNAAAQATNFAMVLKAGETAYVAEMRNLATAGTLLGPQVYARAIY